MGQGLGYLASKENMTDPIVSTISFSVIIIPGGIREKM